jgi:DNA-directed RNA polymerase specialized sigma24 family protein
MDDDELSLHLADPDPLLQAKGIHEARSRYEKALRLMLIRKHGITDVGDQDEIICEALHAIYCRAQEGNIDLSTPPKAILFRITHNKAVDLIRKRARRIPTASETDQATQEVLNANFADIEWHSLERRGLAKEILDQFILEIPGMPERQAQVARAIPLLFGLNSNFTANDIRDAIEYLSGDLPPLASVKTAWNEVRKKLRLLIPKDL